ncbi:hypothetical protein, partial [Anaplasma phagocytophilum]|uniref:hypothetical protein n=1 Tax=Anaplasma phagocytophilum TaxID=948 RepID=UPI001E506C3C
VEDKVIGQVSTTLSIQDFPYHLLFLHICLRWQIYHTEPLIVLVCTATQQRARYRLELVR